jgi:tellurite resistance protein TerC
MHVSRIAWVSFGVLVTVALAADLGAMRRERDRGSEPSFHSSVVRSLLWTLLAAGFGVAVGAAYGQEQAVTWFTAYVVEETLSLDNLFVFVLIFSYLQIPEMEQRRVLLWGVLGAFVFRALMIAGGIYFLGRFHWITYPFAALILFAAIRLLFGQEKQQQFVQASCNVCSTWVARIIPVTSKLHGGKFVVRVGGRLEATPLLVALVVAETMDIVFALDSVPAVLSVTRDPFLVYTSNVFAILGLRSLYAVLAGALERLRYLRVGIAMILAFVAAKLLLGDIVHISNQLSLAVIAVALFGSILAGLLPRDS